MELEKLVPLKIDLRNDEVRYGLNITEDGKVVKNNYVLAVGIVDKSGKQVPISNRDYKLDLIVDELRKLNMHLQLITGNEL